MQNAPLNISAAELTKPRAASLPIQRGGGLEADAKRTLTKFKAKFWTAVGKVADATDKNVVRPVVKAENRVKVAALKVRQKGINTFSSAADTAGKAVEYGQKAVDRLKWVYIGIGALVVIYFIAQARAAFGRRP